MSDLLERILGLSDGPIVFGFRSCVSRQRLVNLPQLILQDLDFTLETILLFLIISNLLCDRCPLTLELLDSFINKKDNLKNGNKAFLLNR